MKMNTSFRVEVTAVCMLLIGGGLYFGLKPTPIQEQKRLQEAEIAKKIESQNEQSVASATDSKPEQLMARIQDQALQQEVVGEAVVLETLREYRGLGKKVIMSEAERIRRQEILEDSGFLLSLRRDLLGNGAIARDEAANQDAVKILLEAMAYSEASLAESIVRDIISDPTIENASVPMSDRERMAGTKAELMYVWSSKDYAASSVIRGLLPGTVSEKIWKNVQSLQAINEAESTRLAQRFEETGSHYRDPKADQ